MSLHGRPKGEYRSAQHEGNRVITTAPELLSELRRRGLTPAADAAVTARASGASDPGADRGAAHPRPWYIALLLGVSGWMAGLFLLGFVGLLFRPDAPTGAALAGATLLAAAWGLFKVDRDGAFLTQFALALSIAGQCLLLFAMNHHPRGVGPVAASALLLQAGLALLMPNPLHRSLSTLFAAVAWALTVRFLLLGEPAYWGAPREASASPVHALAAWLAAWLPIGAALWLLIRREAAWIARGWAPLLRPVLTGLTVGLAFATLASQPFESFRWLGDATAARPDWLALWPMLSALGALGAVGAGFALRSRALMGACLVAALLHLSHFYYALGTSLLLKSLLMLAMGAVLLFAGKWLARREAA